MTCPRCGGSFREIQIAIESGERCDSISCIHCGNTVDEVILENRTVERREFWRRKADQEMLKPLSRIEKILQEYEPEAIRFNL